MATLNPGDRLSLAKLGYATGVHNNCEGTNERTSLGACGGFTDCSDNNVLTVPASARGDIAMSDFAIDQVTGLSIPKVKDFAAQFTATVTFNGAGCHFLRRIAPRAKHFSWSGVEVNLISNNGYQSVWELDIDAANVLPYEIPGYRVETFNETGVGSAALGGDVDGYFRFQAQQTPGGPVYAPSYIVTLFSADAQWNPINQSPYSPLNAAYSRTVGPQGPNNIYHPGSSGPPGAGNGLVGAENSGSTGFSVVFRAQGNGGNWFAGATYPSFSLPQLKMSRDPTVEPLKIVDPIERRGFDGMSISVTFADCFNDRLPVADGYNKTFTKEVEVDTAVLAHPGIELTGNGPSSDSATDGVLNVRPIFFTDTQKEPSSWTLAVFGPTGTTVATKTGTAPTLSVNIGVGIHYGMVRNNSTGMQRVWDAGDIVSAGGSISEYKLPDPASSGSNPSI